MKNSKRIFVFMSALLLSNACTPADPALDAGGEDFSASGIAAAAVGGTLVSLGLGKMVAMRQNQNLLSRGIASIENLLPDAFSRYACPTYQTLDEESCQTRAGQMWLAYRDCSFGKGAATWSGTQSFRLSEGMAQCGKVITPGPGQNLIRQMVEKLGSAKPSTALRTNSFGTGVTIDDASVNLSNFEQDLIPPLLNEGYGTKLFVDAQGNFSSLQIKRRFLTSKFDETVVGNLNLKAEAAPSSSRQVQGDLKIYLNRFKILGKAHFDHVVHDESCCLPVSGQITTEWSAGHSIPLAQAEELIGKRETLKFTGCGTAELTSSNGVKRSVSLGNCF